MTRTILHADLDAFYAAVEVLDDPSLRGRPVIVGGRSDERGVVSAASYEARRYGVHSAMPLRTAARLCPDGAFIAGHPDRYREASTAVMRIFASFTPLVEPISLDEAFLDVTASRAVFGDGEAIAAELKRRVQAETGLVVSVGVASNKLCAKIASDLRKPDALVVVAPGQEAAFLAPLPVGRLWGVGPQVRRALIDYGVSTIGQLAGVSGAALRRRFGAHGLELGQRARGVDPSPVTPTQAPRSIGHEHTFSRDVVERSRLEATLLDIAESVASRLRAHGLSAGAIQLKLRYEGFETITRQMPLPRQTRESEPIYEAGVALLQRSWSTARAIRLIGLTAIGLAELQQLTLFDEQSRSERVARSLDAVRARFGESAITRARLLVDRPQRRFDFGERQATQQRTANLEEPVDK
ncbi:MAG: DNA polymerase IV [Chloroflexota bacterium]|nr:DNA polymerase IV [Chloroflexota bacterium]